MIHFGNLKNPVSGYHYQSGDTKAQWGTPDQTRFYHLSMELP